LISEQGTRSNTVSNTACSASMSACRGVWRSAQLRKVGFCGFATLQCSDSGDCSHNR